jgi:hypothetical protein
VLSALAVLHRCEYDLLFAAHLWVGPDIDVKCGLVGLPHLMDGRKTTDDDRRNLETFELVHADLFRALVSIDNVEILQTDIMVAAITFKWGKYGKRVWYASLC